MARERYELLLITALRDIASDPERPGSAECLELGVAVRKYHLRHSRQRAVTPGGFVRRPRHLLIYQIGIVVGIGRVLHDSMEPGRHAPQSYEDG